MKKKHINSTGKNLLDFRLRNKPIHPMENDDSLPEKIRGKHFDSWTQLAKELGYGE